MATKKITQLEALTEADDSDVLVIVDVSEGETKKITKNNFLVGTGHTIELSLDPSTYVLTLILKNEAGTALSTQSVNLPSEDALTNITYSNGILTLTKQSGGTSTVDISGLITALKSVVGIDTDTYNSSLTYNVGDIVVQNEKIYKAKEDNITGTFDVAKWDEISLYQYQKIQDKKITKLEEKVEDLVDDQETGINSGTSIYINDSADDEFRRFSPEGHSEQDGEPSPENEQPIESAGENIQLFDKNAVTIQEGYLHSTEKVLYYVTNRKYFYISCEPNEDYTISKKAGQWFRVGTFSSVPEVGSTAINVVSNDTGDKITINSGVGANYLLVNYVHTERDTLTEQEILDSIKIEKGTVATPYSPYGMGSITEKIVNKNWFNINDEPLSKNSVTVQHLTDGLRITNTGTNQHNNAMYKVMDVKNYLGQKITFTAYAKSSASNPAMIYLRIGNKTGTNFVTSAVTSSTTLDGKLTTTITVPDSLPSDMSTLVGSLYATRFVTPTVGDYVDYTNIQVELGSTATSYVPHQEQTKTYYTQQPFRSIGDVRDCFVKKSDGWYERHYIGEEVLDGTETTLTKVNAKTNSAYFENTNPIFESIATNVTPNALCNYLIAKNANSMYATDVEGFTFSSSGNLRFNLLNTVASTVAELKTWLSTHNLIVDGILATPIDLPCTEEQIQQLEDRPKSYKKDTYIYSIDKVNAFLNVEYIKYIDLTNYVKNTDYATSTKGGTVKIGTYGSDVSPDGILRASTYSYTNYPNVNNNAFISKGTLENVIAGKQLENETNKVINIDENSTDAQYPSAKAVYKENEALKNKLNKFKSQLPQVKDEGYEATLNDTIEDDFTQFDPEGHSGQETTEGRNYLPQPEAKSETNNGVTVTSYADGSYTIKGTPTLSASVAFDIDEITIPANSYLHLRNIGGTTSNTAISLRTGNTNAFSTSFNSSNKIQSISGEITINKIAVIWNSNQVGTAIDITLQPSIELTDEVTDFEKYTNGASPNPSYEQPIESAGEEEKNVFNKELFGEFTSEIKTLEIQLEPNTAYTMSSDIPYSTFNVACLFFKLPSQSYGTGTNGVKEGQSRTLTTDSTGIVNVGYRQTGITGDNPKDNYWYQINKGSEVKPYVPYGMGSITEKIVNKNWFDKDNANILNATIGTTQGTNYGSIVSSNNGKCCYIKCNSNTTYTVSRKPGLRFVVGIISEIPTTGKVCSDIVINSTGRSITITTADTTQYLVVYYYLNGTDTLTEEEIRNSIQIEQGSTATDYVPHEEQTKTYYTQQPFRSNKDKTVRDCFVKKSDGWYERHYIGRKYLKNYSYYVTQSLGGENLFRISSSQLSDVSQVQQTLMSNIFIGTSSSQGASDGNIYYNSNTGDIDIICDAYDNEGDFITMVTNKNGYFDCILEEPLDLPCTSEQIQQLENRPSTYSGQTNVNSEDEIEAYLEVSGIYDLNNLITRVEVIESEV